MNDIRFVQPKDTLAPKGHYSPGVIHGGLVYVSGQLPIDHATGKVEAGGIEAQTERALRNVEVVLREAGSGLDRLVQVTIYLTDVRLWSQVNEVYARSLGNHKPARAIVTVGPLHFGALLEIQAIAVAPSPVTEKD